MGRNEIRLRRQRMSAGNIARHRNYGELMHRHERDQKLKRIFRLFVYFLVIAFLLIILIIVVRWEKRSVNTTKAFLNSEVVHASPQKLCETPSFLLQ